MEPPWIGASSIMMDPLTASANDAGIKIHDLGPSAVPSKHLRYFFANVQDLSLKLMLPSNHQNRQNRINKMSWSFIFFDKIFDHLFRYWTGNLYDQYLLVDFQLLIDIGKDGIPSYFWALIVGRPSLGGNPYEKEASFLTLSRPHGLSIDTSSTLRKQLNSSHLKRWTSFQGI